MRTFSMARINVRKISKTTLLVIGEGAHDTAFLNHLKSLYDARESGQKVKIESGDGGSPHDLIKNTIKKISHLSYDRVVIFLDSDVEIKESDKIEAKRHRITLILSEPAMAINAVAPPGGCKVFVICIKTIDNETAKGAAIQIKSGNNL